MTEATANNALEQQALERTAELQRWAKVLARPANYNPAVTRKPKKKGFFVALRALFN